MTEAWASLVQQGHLEEALVSYVERRDFLSVVEVMRDFGQYTSVAGDQTLTIIHPSLVVWAGMSTAFADALGAVIQQKRIYCEPCSPLVYVFDGGGVLRFPIAKATNRAIQHGYTKDHWLPLVLRPIAVRERLLRHG